MSQPNIIASYLMKNILVIFLAIFFIISFLIFGNIFATILKSTLQQNIDIFSLLKLVFIKSLRDISIIINLSFFLAIIVAINKLYKNSEIMVLNTIGISEIDLFKKIIPLIIIIAIIISSISMFLVPYSQAIQQKIKQNINTNIFNFIKAEKFQKLKGNNSILYTNNNKDGLGEVFLYTKKNKNITLAKNVSKHQDNNGNVYLRLKDGMRYNGFLGSENKKIFNFESLDIKIMSNIQNDKIIKISSASKSMSILLKNLNLINIAELQWRFSLIFSLPIIAFIGILLAKSLPRSNTNFGILWGVIIFAIYFNLLKIIKSGIENSEFSPILASFSIHLLFLGLAILYLYRNTILVVLTKKY